MQFQIFQESRIGARPTNQDRVGYVATSGSLLMTVCDGMGGHARGEIASQICLDSISNSFKNAANPKLKDPVSFLIGAIQRAHDEILSYARLLNLAEAPRTTCVAAVLQDGKASWAHVGDSRLYFLGSGKVHARTIDHSHVQSLIDRGFITLEQSLKHPERNKIFNCLGQSVNPRIDFSDPITLLDNDKLLLCSDGFWGPLSPELLAKSVEFGSIGVNIPMLMDLAEVMSGRECDNLSVIAMTWMKEETMNLMT